MKGTMRRRLDNPWTADEVAIDDGIWHGTNPREDGFAVKDAEEASEDEEEMTE